MPRTGVYPCYENQFQIETKPATTEPEASDNEYYCRYGIIQCFI